MSDRSSDRRFMRRALALALRGRGTTAPNPMVGAVVVSDGTIVGEGFTQPFGGAHAEVQALRVAGDAARGATVYATLEPCASHGKTPPCAQALIAAGVARVVFAAADPNPAMRGGAAVLEAAGIDVDGGVEAQAALDQNPAFFHRFQSSRPFVTLKLALSLDGAMADARRTRAWITGVASQREVHRQRADHDAIAVGIGTAVSDDPELTVRGDITPRVAPARIVFDRTGRLSLESRLVRTAREVPVTVVGTAISSEREAALAARGVSVLQADGLAGQLQALRTAGVESMYCEGGAALADALLDDRLVDRLVIFRAPVQLGAGAVRPLLTGAPVSVGTAARYRLVAHRRLGDDLMAIYDLTTRVHGTR